jgi:hypothetical protein
MQQLLLLLSTSTPQTTLWALFQKTTLSGLNGHNLAHSRSIKISLVPINSSLSREWIDTKFVIYYTFFLKIELQIGIWIVLFWTTILTLIKNLLPDSLPINH